MKEIIIVFIDNSISTLQLFKDYFYDLNSNKMFFTSAKEFLTWKNKEKTDCRLIIISDYNMADINGVELLKQIDFPVMAKILLSNITNSKQIAEVLRNGHIDEYLQKDETDSFSRLEVILKKYLSDSFIYRK